MGLRDSFLEVFRMLREGVLVDILDFVGDTMPIWLPLLLLYGFWQMWVGYVRFRFISRMEHVLLEVRLPKEIQKSPVAMELVLNSLQQTFGEATFIAKYWEGGVRPWFSLELVSIGGDVHFLLWLPKGSRRGVEAQIYAQYPDVEIQEVEHDYALGVDFKPEKVKLWGAEFTLDKPDPYPIKTYVDYGMDKDPKEEHKIDPITPMMEYLGSLNADEQAWFQILVRAHKKEDRVPGKLFKKTDNWKDQAKEEIKKIVGEATFSSSEDSDAKKFINISSGQREVVEALERSISKLAFDVGIRAIYIAKPDAFDPGSIGGLIGSFRQYNTNHLNGFRPSWVTGFDYPWQDFKDIRTNARKHSIFDAYRRRSWFHPPYRRKHFILNTEELATIYHFPGGVATTPTLGRLSSRKAEPPTNLPQ